MDAGSLAWRDKLKDDIRETVLCQGRKKPETPRVEVPTQVGQIFLENLCSGFSFIPAELPDVYIDSRFEETGMLHHRRKPLSHFRNWCGLGEADDDLILEVLDNLAKTGQIKVFHVANPDRTMHYNDCSFGIEIGRGVRSWQGADAPRFSSLRYYADEPLRKKEHDKFSIFDVKARVEAIRKDRDERFRKRFGASGLEMESKLHREKIEEELDLKRRLIRQIDEK
jgi:hypothetical protein